MPGRGKEGGIRGEVMVLTKVLATIVIAGAMWCLARRIVSVMLVSLTFAISAERGKGRIDTHRRAVDDGCQCQMPDKVML